MASEFLLSVTEDGLPVGDNEPACSHEPAELPRPPADAEMLTGAGPRAAYLLGLAEGHLANMIELVRAVTR